MKLLKIFQGFLLLALLSGGMALQVLAADEPAFGIRQTGAAERKAFLTWDRRGEAVSYEIYYKYASGGGYHFLRHLNTSADHPRVTVRLPKPGRKYHMKVVPYGLEGQEGPAYDLQDCVTLPGNITLGGQKSYPTSQSMKVYWKGAESAEGYEFLVQSREGNFVKRYRFGKGSSAVLDKIPSGDFYRLRIRGYTRVDGKIAYGRASYTYIAQQPRVKFKWASHSVTLASWGEVKGAADYSVYLSDNPSKGFRRVKTVTKGQTPIPGLSKNRKYYVYVVAEMRKGKNIYVSPKTSLYTFRLHVK